MKNIKHILIVGSLSWLVNNAAAAGAISLAPVGPGSAVAIAMTGNGSVQVYSARQIHDPSYLWDIYVGGSERDGWCDAAHTDYTIYSQDGKVAQKVRNARNPNDDQPALVSLAPGLYTVKAQARDYGVVTVPITVKSGQTTVVNLQRNAQRLTYKAHKEEYVWLYGYRLVGPKAESGEVASQAPVVARQP